MPFGTTAAWDAPVIHVWLRFLLSLLCGNGFRRDQDELRPAALLLNPLLRVRSGHDCRLGCSCDLFVLEVSENTQAQPDSLVAVSAVIKSRSALRLRSKTHCF